MFLVTRTPRRSRRHSAYRVSLFRMFVAYIAFLSSRKAVMTAHPDKGGSEAKMATVNEAYEVLSNPGTHRYEPSAIYER